MWKVPLFELDYGEEESAAVQQVLDSQWLTMGEQIQSFEQEFCDFSGGQIKATAVTNCTAALHMALLAAGVGVGDEVIIPALTFVADANAVSMTGAAIALADCDSLDNWNVSARTISEQISEKTKAIIVVHFAGYPCDMDEIVALCEKHSLVLIEDVAHAPGASYKDQPCGTMGDMGCFSFFSNKNLSIGEGGMLLTKDAALHQKVGFLRSHGMTTLTLDRHKGRAVSYDVAQPGLNYRMDEMRAALGRVQLEKLQENNLKRGKLVEHYCQQLADVSGISIPFTSIPNAISSYHIFPVLLSEDIDRLHIIERLKGYGIQSSIHYPSFRDFSAYRDQDFDPTPIADDISSRELTLPLYPSMSFEQVDLVVDSLIGAMS